MPSKVHNIGLRADGPHLRAHCSPDPDPVLVVYVVGTVHSTEARDDIVLQHQNKLAIMAAPIQLSSGLQTRAKSDGKWEFGAVECG